MRAKQSLLFLITVILLLALAACSGGTDEYPAPESGPQSPSVPAADEASDEAAEPDNEPYPAPAETADNVQEPQAEAYPAPAESVADSPPAQSPPAAEAYPLGTENYPPPLESAEGAGAYPAPDAASENTGQEPNSFLGQTAVQDNASLTGRVWVFEQFSSPSAETLLAPPETSEINSVEFLPDGRVSIVAGCSTAHGTYSAGDGSINIQAVSESHEPCASPSIGSQFLQWLNESAAYTIEGSTLSLVLPRNSGTLRLAGSDILSYAGDITEILNMRGGRELSQTQPRSLEELMDASLDELVYHEGIPPELAVAKSPGAVMLIDSPSGSMIKAGGFADIEEKRPMSTYDRLEIGSNTAMFTGVLLAQLQEEGLLSLDDSLSKWLPELSADIPNGDEITLRQLATHTSGIPDYGEAVIGAGAGDSEALRSGYTPQELVRLAVENLPPDFSPGEPGQWHYSNTGYILLGMVLEAASGQSYADLLQNRIFSPLGMTNTELLEGTPYMGSIVDGYLAFPYDINTTEWNGTQGWAAGGIISTAPDMAKFGRALMSGSLFRDPATLDLMTGFIKVSENEAVGRTGGSGYGIGLMEFAPGLWGHRGQTIGFTSLLAMDPSRDLIFVALTNSAETAVGGEQLLMGQFLHQEE